MRRFAAAAAVALLAAMDAVGYAAAKFHPGDLVYIRETHVDTKICDGYSHLTSPVSLVVRPSLCTSPQALGLIELATHRARLPTPTA